MLSISANGEGDGEGFGDGVAFVDGFGDGAGEVLIFKTLGDDLGEGEGFAGFGDGEGDGEGEGGSLEPHLQFISSSQNCLHSLGLFLQYSLMLVMQLDGHFQTTIGPGKGTSTAPLDLAGSGAGCSGFSCAPAAAPTGVSGGLAVVLN